MRRLLLGNIRAWQHIIDVRAFLYLAFNGRNAAEGVYDSRERRQSP